jgi:hypothetical protein
VFGRKPRYLEVAWRRIWQRRQANAIAPVLDAHGVRVTEVIAAIVASMDHAKT